MLRAAVLVHRLGTLRCRNRFWKARHGTVGIGQRFDMFFVVLRNNDHREVLATHAHCAEQSHSVRAGFKVDYGKIELASRATDNLQSVVGAVRQVTEATTLLKDIRDTILQL